jgi:hypothetical protein
MEATNETYQIWDDETGNIIAKFGTSDEAVSFLKDMFDENGPDGVRELAVIEYPADGTAPRTALEGADFLARYQIPA